MKIRIAELNIEIFERYPRIVTHCRDYLAAFEKADITVSASNAEIAAECARATSPISPDVAELACVYRAIAGQLPRFQAFVLHAAVVEYKGLAYAFSAPSGTGKSTHVALWLQAFGDEARILNGDKPIFRYLNGRFYAFGTPWCGKEGIACNASAPLAGLCFLERAAENSISPLPPNQAVKRLFYQIIMPSNGEQTLQFVDLLGNLTQEVPLYLLHCNRDAEAAQVALAGMQKGAFHDSY